MKILHTSDWHLGHLLYEHDRTEEMHSFLEQLKNEVATHQPDALVVCGDIFDRTTAPVSARDMYVRALLEIRDRAPKMRIIVTAGNHDGKSNLEVEGLLWDRLDVKVVGQVERGADGSVNYERHIVEIADAAGKRCGFVVAVPHIYEYGYPQVVGADTKEERQRAFFQTLLDETARRNPEGRPVVLTAHLAMTGGNFAGHSFADTVGGIETVDQEVMGKGYDYLALGHIHNAMTFATSGAAARYCGTPIPVSFDEQGRHTISLVTLEKGQDPIIEEIEIKNPKPLLTIPGEPANFEEALRELSDFPNNEKAYVRLNVLLDGPLPANYVERIVHTLEGKQAQYCCVKTSLPKREKGNGRETEELHFDADNMPKPQALADLFYQNRFNLPLDGEMMTMLEQAIREAQHETENQ